MATGAVATKDMKNTLINRGFKASPDYTAYSRGSIGTGTTTPVESDTGLESVISNWAAGSSDYKNYASGYPSFDEANKRVTVRVFVASTEANSESITEYGCFNTDGTPRIGGHFVFSAITKTSSIQVYITPTYKFT